MVDTLLSVIQSTLLDTFSLEYDASWTVELDSSTPGNPLFYLPFSFICAEFALLLEFHFTYCVLSVFYLAFHPMESSRLWWSSMLDIDNFFMVRECTWLNCWMPNLQQKKIVYILLVCSIQGWNWSERFWRMSLLMGYMWILQRSFLDIWSSTFLAQPSKTIHMWELLLVR